MTIIGLLLSAIVYFFGLLLANFLQLSLINTYSIGWILACVVVVAIGAVNKNA